MNIEAEQIKEATERITPEKVLGILKPLSERLAASGTVSLTRGPLIAEFWGDSSVGSQRGFHLFTIAENLVINPGGEKKLFAAHGDQISYLVPQETQEGETELVPFCAHRASPGKEYNGLVLRYSKKEEGLKVTRQMEPIAQGKIGTTEKGLPYFTGGGSLPPLRTGDRVVYNYPVEAKGDLLSGNLDNAAGMATCLAAALTMKEIAQEAKVNFRDLEVSFIFTDEEEGPPASNATFGRGLRRYLRRTNQYPKMMVNIDGHDVRISEESDRGALYASFVSGGKGPVVPPQLYVPFRNFMEGLKKEGVRSATTESVGRVSRSDDVAMMEVDPNVLILGYGTENCHFNEAVPTANLSDLVDLSKAIVWTALKFEPLR